MKTQGKIVILSFLFGVVIWVVDALLDYLTFYPGSFWSLLIYEIPPHELYIRSLILTLFIVFGMIASTTVGRLKRTEQSLASERELLAITLSSIGDGVISTDKSGKIASLNRTGEELTGWTEAEALGRPLEEVFHIVNEKTRERCENPAEKVLRTGLVVGLANDTVLIRRDGTERILADSGAPIFGKDRTTYGVVLVFRDITERRKAEETLQIQRRQFKLLAEQSPFGVVMMAEDGTFQYINPKFVEMFGYDLTEVPNGKEWFRRAYPDPVYRREVVSAWVGDLSRHKPGEQRPRVLSVRCKDGTEKTVHFRPVQLETGEHFMTCEDITDRTRAEKVLVQAKEEWEATFDAVPDLVAVIDPNHRVLRLNKAMADKLGLSKEDVVGMTCYEIVHRTSSAIPSCPLVELLKGDQDHIYAEVLEPRLGGVFQVSVSALRDGHGNISGCVHVSRDITAKREAEKAMRESEEKFSKAFQFAPVPMVIASVEEGRLVEVNDAFVQTFEYDRSEVLGRTSVELGIWRNEDERASWVKTVKKQGFVRNLEVAFSTKTDRRYGLFSSVALQISGEPCLLSSMNDITERKRAEEAADRANQEWERTFNAISDLVMVLDSQHKIIRANKAMADALGMTKQELIGKLCFELVHGEKEPPVFCPHSQLLADGEEHSAEVVEPRLGGIYDVRVSPLIDQGRQVIGSVHVTRDITERKKAEAAIGQQRDFLQQLIDTIPTPIFYKDAEGRYMGCNRAFESDTGMPRANIMGKTVFDLAPPDLAQTYHEQDLSLFRNRGIQQGETRRQDAAGNMHDVMFTKATFSDLEGNVAGLVGVILDITERKKAELELQQSNDMLRAIIEATPTAIIGLDLEGNVQTVWNPAAEKMLGWSAHEVMGRPLPSVPVESQEEFRRFRERIRSGETLDGVEVRRQRRDGTPIDYSIYASPLHDAEGRISGNIAVLVDITERKRAEEEREKLQAQLLQAQKMEAIGTLAGGIAHDFNNLLQVIQGYADIALLDIKHGQPGHSALREIRSAARSAAELTHGLLTFSRRVESKMRPVNINKELQHVAKMLARTLPKMIEIEMKLAEETRTIKADPAQLQQVVMNLAVNARDAMPDGGRLVIETHDVFLDEEHCRTHLGTKSGNYVLLSLSDNGVGMDSGTISHIFDPFFTTKEAGRGTGLGLAIVYGIVKHHGGNIICYSELGHGTTFKVYLPAMETGEEADDSQETREISGGSETVLLVDDEESVRNLGETMLNKFGYTVLTASDGREGLEIYRKNRMRISLVILDLVMPEMTGRDCLKEILTIDPSAKVLVASGYASNGLIERAVEEGAKASIRKPYETRPLLELVRRVLDEL